MSAGISLPTGRMNEDQRDVNGRTVTVIRHILRYNTRSTLWPLLSAAFRWTSLFFRWRSRKYLQVITSWHFTHWPTTIWTTRM